ncbi:phage tail protein [Roseateles sp.]|uniref:phage tail protein n=1 Tax=Roseateles sp. TaxID=1971397 RepID=UPI002E08867C|nr:tail fiber protein [Roseateles sp.]
MSEPFIAEIRVLPFNFAPTGWATCDGQLIPISQNTALFALLGTTYGGDGRVTFALPNLGGRMAMGFGQGPGLSPRELGESVGQASVTLTDSQVPTHVHGLMGGSSGLAASPANAVMAPPANGASVYRAPGALAPMAAESLSQTGGGAAHENRQPVQGLNFCIALQGIFPARG